MPTYNLGEIAERAGCQLVGSPDPQIRGVAPLTEAGPDELAFVDAGHRSRASSGFGAAALLVAEPLEECPVPQLVTPHLKVALGEILGLFVKEGGFGDGVDPTAVIHPEARIDDSAHIGPHCVVGRGAQIGEGSRLDAGVILYPRVTIGRDCHLMARVVLHEDTEIGDRVVLGAGVIVGGTGFGLATGPDGVHRTLPHLGRVVIEDDVEVGSNSAIDRALLSETRIGRGSRLDNLVQVGHNCRIGPYTIVCGQVGMAGSTTTGHHVVLGGQAGLAGHLHVGDGAMVGAKTGITNDVPPGEVLIGIPPFPRGTFARVAAALGKLPGLLQRVKRLERQIGEPTEAGRE